MKHVFKYCNNPIAHSYVASALFRAVLEDAFLDIFEKLETDRDAADNYGELIEEVCSKMGKHENSYWDGDNYLKKPAMRGEPFAQALEMAKLLFTEIQANYNKVNPSWTDREPYELWLTKTTHPMSKDANQYLNYMKNHLTKKFI